jgi:UDP-galactopyranose mutase
MVQEPDYQGIGVMHHPGMDVTYTRTMEWKHLHPESNNTERTLVTFEHPWDVNEITCAEPYYPIDTINNILTRQSYKFLSLQEKNIFFGGRLAEYKYYDMDDVIKKALQDIQVIGKR